MIKNYFNQKKKERRKRQKKRESQNFLDSMKNKNDGLILDNVIKLIRHYKLIFIRGYDPMGTNCDCRAEEIPLVCQPTRAS